MLTLVGLMICEYLFSLVWTLVGLVIYEYLLSLDPSWVGDLWIFIVFGVDPSKSCHPYNEESNVWGSPRLIFTYIFSSTINTLYYDRDFSKPSTCTGLRQNFFTFETKQPFFLESQNAPFSGLKDEPTRCKNNTFNSFLSLFYSRSLEHFL